VLSDRMLKALNEQINAELYSAYLYLAMAADFEEKGLEGMAHWMEIQFQEEQGHALKIYRYVIDRGGRVTLDAIEKPQTTWDSPLAIFEAALAHERHVSELIGKLASLATEENDHATHNMLQWFISEQVEEEATADAIVGKLRMVGDQGQGLFMMDGELGQRTLGATPGA